MHVKDSTLVLQTAVLYNVAFIFPLKIFKFAGRSATW